MTEILPPTTDVNNLEGDALDWFVRCARHHMLAQQYKKSKTPLPASVDWVRTDNLTEHDRYTCWEVFGILMTDLDMCLWVDPTTTTRRYAAQAYPDNHCTDAGDFTITCTGHTPQQAVARAYVAALCGRQVLIPPALLPAL